MRRQLLAELPLLTRFYGLKPADLDGMTLREISEYRARLQQIQAEGGSPWSVLRAES